MQENKILSKSPQESIIESRKIVSPEMLNPNGTLFGGVIMSWIDEIAFMTARRHSGRPFVVTVSIDHISFLIPIKMGEHIFLSACVNYVGTSSMEIGVKVEKEDPYTGDRVHANSAYLTFVSLDEAGKPTKVPELKLYSDDDIRRYKEARLRVRIREKLRRRMKRKLNIDVNSEKVNQSPNDSIQTQNHI